MDTLKKLFSKYGGLTRGLWRSVDRLELKVLDMATLTGVQKAYILHWGEMGTRWGINRTVAQIHALPVSVSAGAAGEEIAADAERGAVECEHVDSRTSRAGGIVRAVHVLGDRPGTL